VRSIFFAPVEDILSALEAVSGRKHPSTVQVKQLKICLPLMPVLRHFVTSPVNNTIQYNTIRYKICNAPYVTKMLFVGAGMTVLLGRIGNVKKMSLKFTFKNIDRVAGSNVIRQIVPIYSSRVFETTQR